MAPTNVGSFDGRKIAPNYANLFLAKWEENILEKCVLKPQYTGGSWMIFYDLVTLQGRIL